MSLVTGIIKDADKYLGFINIVFVVYPEIIGTYAISEVHHAWREPVETNTFFIIGTEGEGFALLQEKRFIRLGGFFGKDLDCAVVKDVSVLVDLQE